MHTTRKKLAQPPVKAACTACRASRTRCDGKRDCTSCVKKSRECIYVPSKRGGPRVSRRAASKALSSKSSITQPADQDSILCSPLPLTDPTRYTDLPNSIHFSGEVLSMVNPGAGLAQTQGHQELDQDSDMIFDSIFNYPTPPSTTPGSGSLYEEEPSLPATPIVRAYGSDSDLLNGYYIFIHQYFPILPPPSLSASLCDNAIAYSMDDLEAGDDEYHPSSPLSLVIAAILALIPHEQDADWANEEAVLFRRKYSYFLVQSALESIEIESELPGSSVDPSDTLTDSHDRSMRASFHPMVPVELESIIALDLLSIYEYSQRGNINRMRSRAGQALVAAMNLSLHSRGGEFDQFEESRRRAWWMTYICVCQASIYSSCPPIISLYDPSFTTLYPSTNSDIDAWPFFIQAQQTILSATLFVVDLNKTLERNENLDIICDRMQQLEQEMAPLVAQADKYAQCMPSFNPVDSDEEIVAETLKSMARVKLNSARIKLHRFCAFFDHPIFSKKYCDLKPISSPLDFRDRTPSMSSMACCSTSMISMNINMDLDLPLTPSEPTVASSGQDFRSTGDLIELFPFSSRASQKICLKSALNIVQSFETLPYPFLISNKPMPRTMPSMSCCAMQAGYALLMLRQKTLAEKNASNDIYVQTLFIKMHRALVSIASTLENYSIASEAIAGMRDQIQEFIQTHFGN
ncbi:hypothetical protein BT63DRAFT_478522 [Microthyrium microscopicum]|uniref:Zn(2)-C6 fungal-type domain-containing protein n=1 Tax=Microthyrium microscopicum TaxID=703497 RepID=A0A6A6UFY9_9PEZI|nr:hypothetical protein BT63DRAFT_478522 [Microthyrium microscopicum]